MFDIFYEFVFINILVIKKWSCSKFDLYVVCMSYNSRGYRSV